MDEPEWSLPAVELFHWAKPDFAPPEDQKHAPDMDVGERAHEKEPEYKEGTFYAHVVGTLAEFYELHGIAEAGEVLATHEWLSAGALAPLGYVATIVVTAQQFYDATSTGHRIQGEMGMTYGMVWEVLGLPDVEHTTHLDGERLSQYEHKGWEEGVAEGRKYIQEHPEAREQIIQSLNYEMWAQRRDYTTDPTHHAWHEATNRVLNRVWAATHEDLAPLNSVSLPWMGENDGFPTPKR
jgi:hypothetical protein